MGKMVDEIKSMPVKQQLAYVFAILAFIIGWGLTIFGFVVSPLGIVDNSVLWILGQSLAFVGSVIGIAMTYESKLDDFKVEMRNEMGRRKTYQDESPEEDFR